MLPRYDIVVGVDLSENADIVLLHAFDEAGRRARPRLHVLAVIEHARDESVVRRRICDMVRQTLDDAIPAEQRASWEILVHVRCGHPDEEIVELAEETFARMIVVGHFSSHRHRLWHPMSTADRVVETAACPVLVVMPPRERDAAARQCPDCVAVRRDTEGEQWFCLRHHDEHLGRVLVGPTFIDPLGHAGTMW